MAYLTGTKKKGGGALRNNIFYSVPSEPRHCYLNPLAIGKNRVTNFLVNIERENPTDARNERGGKKISRGSV